MLSSNIERFVNNTGKLRSAQTIEMLFMVCILFIIVVARACFVMVKFLGGREPSQEEDTLGFVVPDKEEERVICYKNNSSTKAS